MDKFVLLGHSLGAFLACSYAMKYPARVKHLILVDPWGFSTRPVIQSGAERRIPAWASAVSMFLTHFNPLSALRIAGPIGKAATHLHLATIYFFTAFFRSILGTSN